MYRNKFKIHVWKYIGSSQMLSAMMLIIINKLFLPFRARIRYNIFRIETLFKNHSQERIWSTKVSLITAREKQSDILSGSLAKSTNKLCIWNLRNSQKLWSNICLAIPQKIRENWRGYEECSAWQPALSVMTEKDNMHMAKQANIPTKFYSALHPPFNHTIQASW